MDGATYDMSSLLVLSSNTGNTRTFVDFICKHGKESIHICEDFNCNINDYDKIAFGSYTWGSGKIPSEMKEFLINNHKDLKGKEVFIFGSGHSIYPNFCGAVDGITKICKDSGAIIKCSYKFEQRFIEEEYSPEELDNLAAVIKRFF